MSCEYYNVMGDLPVDLRYCRDDVQASIRACKTEDCQSKCRSCLESKCTSCVRGRGGHFNSVDDCVSNFYDDLCRHVPKECPVVNRGGNLNLVDDRVSNFYDDLYRLCRHAPAERPFPEYYKIRQVNGKPIGV
jgi:hypothetical protein